MIDLGQKETAIKAVVYYNWKQAVEAIWAQMWSLAWKLPRGVPVDLFLAHLTGRRFLARTRPCCKDYISHLAREHLGIPQEEFKEAILCSFFEFMFSSWLLLEQVYMVWCIKKLICFLIQPTAAALFFPGFLPLSEMHCFSSCPASKGLLCSNWPVQTHTFQMNL